MAKINSVCIVNCFDTYEHRVDLLHDYFKLLGAEVKVVTSDYRHFEKCKRSDCKEDFEFVEAIPYNKNLSMARLKSHSVLSKAIFTKIASETFDVLWVLVPPNSFAKDAAKYKVTHEETKLVLDLIDLWPETMPISKFKFLQPFVYWKNLRDKYLDTADKIVTECNLYHEKLPKRIDKGKIHTIYLAREVKEYNPRLNLPEDKIALCYLGSINNIIDIPKIEAVVNKLSVIKPVVIHIVGDGEKRQEFLKACGNAGAEIIFHGKVYDTNAKQKIFDSCHYGLNIMKDSVCVGLTMKSIDYFEYGLPIINNIHGDTWDLIEKFGIGENIESDMNIGCFKEYDITRRHRVRDFFLNNFSTESFHRSLEEII